MDTRVCQHRLKINGIKYFSKTFLPQNYFWILAKIPTIKRLIVAKSYFVKFSRCKLFFKTFHFYSCYKDTFPFIKLYLKIIMLHNSICRSVNPQSSKVWLESRRATVPYRDYTWRETKLKKEMKVIL